MKFRTNRKSGFTLVEVLIVVVIMAVLAATIIPQFSTSSQDARISAAKFNLNTIRAQLQLYKAQHNGVFPTTLALLTQATNAAGATGSGSAYNLGPYLQVIPDEPFSAANGVATPNAVATTLATDTTFTVGGWYYNSSTGAVQINCAYAPIVNGVTMPALSAW